MASGTAISETSDVPRYLFRAYSPGSDGSNGVTGFWSMAKCRNWSEATSLSRLPRNVARDMLQDHVTWKSWKTRSDDILISFTPSFLFALQHCVRKIASSQRGCTTESNCYICIIDTLKYPSGTFSWTIDLLGQYNLDRTTNYLLRHEYHEAEYLAEYELAIIENSSEHVSFQALVRQGGLFEIMPDLAEEGYGKQLFNRLQQFRRTWYIEEVAVTAQDIDKARRLSLCFGGRWVPVIMMWVLACRARPQQDALVQAEFSDYFNGEITTPYLFANPQTEIASTLRELMEWEMLTRIAFTAQARPASEQTETGSALGMNEAADDAVRAMQNLTL
ncbi:hypothetical protein PV04_08705 [Phialophora macrospora]|uniref:DUF7587 domain-containing protein n=1 Tax=Phialophora macrospora TaxID=1851006 RepID=A0A0D2DN40_9EURO|nr:hypothetical protein PV04_08705 [Phialophora macrospora]